MAKMIPSTVDPESTESEKVVYERLRSQLPDSWTVIHGKRFVLPAKGPHRIKEGEVDFLVLDPKRGYLGIEVKGGGIERDADGWFRREGSSVQRIHRVPGRQAQDGVHGIANYLREHPLFQALGRGPRYGWGVCMPFHDIEGSLGPELPEAFILDRADLDDLRSQMDRLFSANGVEGPPLLEGVADTWTKALTPVFRLVAPLSSRLANAESKLFRMTGEQMGILDNLAETTRVGVKGAAGTGKTVVGFEQAKRLSAEGLRVLFLCYNKPLADELAASAHDFTVRTFHALCGEMTRAAGVRFLPPKRGEEDQGFWETEAPDLLSSALDSLPDDRYDAVIIDEGQDFKEYWWIVIERLLRDPAESRLWVFYDPNQDLYGGGPVETLGLMPARLSFNCRNTKNIARFSSSHIEQEPKLKPDAPDGAGVMEVQCTDEKAMTEAVRKEVHRLVVDEKVPAADIVVLSPLGQSSPSWRAKRLGNLELVDFQQAPAANQLRFGSLQRFKGLEADAIILCDIRPSDPLCSPKHLYVGTSRAKHILSVLSYEGYRPPRQP